MAWFSDISKLPTWALYGLIITTILLSVMILGRIWFPEFVGEEIFWKVFYSYAVIILSTAVISKISDALRKINTPEAPTKNDQQP